jgi:hypothetical protein
MKHLFYLAMVVTSMLACPAAVRAVNAADEARHLISDEMACVADWQKYCSEYSVDSAAIHACFIAHRDKVSPACMEVVRRYRKDER